MQRNGSHTVSNSAGKGAVPVPYMSNEVLRHCWTRHLLTCLQMQAQWEPVIDAVMPVLQRASMQQIHCQPLSHSPTH